MKKNKIDPNRYVEYFREYTTNAGAKVNYGNYYYSGAYSDLFIWFGDDFKTSTQKFRVINHHDRKPTKTFYGIGDVFKFITNEKQMDFVDLNTSDLKGTAFIFLDGSKIVFEYSESFTNDSGTSWPGELEINYYENQP
jgi:hypothetical protein